ncbi:hypothetical protein K438DRAFT_1941505 [Mycena galopus ATCC 62051]|nr:hypothetical protein K438DRAFT_1941505 [Mycena galopus ATCC 62051]
MECSVRAPAGAGAGGARAQDEERSGGRKSRIRHELRVWGGEGCGGSAGFLAGVVRCRCRCRVAETHDDVGGADTDTWRRWARAHCSLLSWHFAAGVRSTGVVESSRGVDVGEHAGGKEWMWARESEGSRRGALRVPPFFFFGFSFFGNDDDEPCIIANGGEGNPGAESGYGKNGSGRWARESVIWRWREGGERSAGMQVCGEAGATTGAVVVWSGVDGDRSLWFWRGEGIIITQVISSSSSPHEGAESSLGGVGVDVDADVETQREGISTRLSLAGRRVTRLLNAYPYWAS